MSAFDIKNVWELQSAVWDTRDGCVTHYPRYCPADCPNAGKHNAELRQYGMCECHQCRHLP